MDRIYRNYNDTEIVKLATRIKCPYCGLEWLEEDLNECGKTYSLTCDNIFDKGCGKEFEVYFDAN